VPAWYRELQEKSCFPLLGHRETQEHHIRSARISKTLGQKRKAGDPFYSLNYISTEGCSTKRDARSELEDPGGSSSKLSLHLQADCRGPWQRGL